MEGHMGYRWLRGQLLACTVAVGLWTTPFSPLLAEPDVPTEQGIRIQQEALIWTTDYEGLIDGKKGDETVSAIKKFQSRLGNPATGNLSDDELVALIKRGFAKRDAIKFKQFTDRTAGVSVGIPSGLLPNPTAKDWGNSWSSNKSGIAIDTLRLKDVSLRNLYDKLLSINDRTIAYQRFVDDNWFVIAAFEKDAAIYVRANLVHVAGQPDEIRGFSIWMSGKRPPDYQSIAPAMLSSFRFNTDSTRDVSAIPVGGVTDTTIKEYKKNDYGYRKPSEPPVPIVTPNTKPVAIGSCFNGLGDCPLSIFAFQTMSREQTPGTSGR
jgi:peptidoglycan hydrolase-like protein with peptidoglycan-binding domain